MSTLRFPFVNNTRVITKHDINVLIQQDRRVTKITIPEGTTGVVIDSYSCYGITNPETHAVGFEWKVGHYYIEAYVLTDDTKNFPAIEVVEDAVQQS